MTAGAVAFCRRVEPGEAAQFLGGQRRLAPQERVVLAGERVEFPVFLFIALNRQCHAQISAFDIVENVVAVDGLEVGGVTGGSKLCDDTCLVRVGHFKWIEKGLCRLLGKRRRPAVPEEAPGWRTLIVEEEGGVGVQITDPGRLANSLLVARRSPELNCQCIRG